MAIKRVTTTDVTQTTNSLIRYALAVVWLTLAAASCSHADVLLDENWSDGSRAETNLPAEAAVWIGREADATVSAGTLSTKMGEASQKIWLYFTDGQPVALANGQKLTASVTFVPRGALHSITSRSFRFGVFYDPTDPRVETDVNSDGGGEGAPWKDAQGYAVQMLMTDDPATSVKALDLGKRVNMESQSLLGASGDYAKMSGGTPAHLELDKEYTLTLEISKKSDKQVDVTASLSEGETQLSTWSLSDDGFTLGTSPIVDKFDLLYVRVSDNETTADQFDFKNFKVEVTGGSRSSWRRSGRQFHDGIKIDLEVRVSFQTEVGAVSILRVSEIEGLALFKFVRHPVAVGVKVVWPRGRLQVVDAGQLALRVAKLRLRVDQLARALDQ